MKYLMLMLSCCLVLTTGWGQTTLQVLTKTIQKTVAWRPGFSVEINGEKAEIQVLPGKDAQILVKAELSAKNPNADSARIDLDNWKFVVTTVGKVIYVRAYIGLSAKAKLPSSSMKSKIIVQVPAACPVNLVNKFGSAKLEKLDGAVVLNGEFCSFDLVQMGGKVQIDSKYGNVAAQTLRGPLQISIRRADLSISGMQNTCSIQSEYGEVMLEASAQTGDVNIKSNKSNITLQTKGKSVHNFDLKSAYGTLQLPEKWSFQLAQPNTHTQTALLQNGPGRKGILVDANFGKILVR
jgi:hypothetical protein